MFDSVMGWGSEGYFITLLKDGDIDLYLDTLNGYDLCDKVYFHLTLFPKYILTNDGIKEKIAITKLFIERKKLEYERLQEELEYDMQKIGNMVND